MVEVIALAHGPALPGPFSAGVTVGQWIFLSGQGGFDPDTGELVSGWSAEQTDQTFRNVEAILEAADASLGDIVSCLAHLADLDQWTEFNAAYETHFPAARPVRTTVARRPRQGDGG